MARSGKQPIWRSGSRAGWLSVLLLATVALGWWWLSTEPAPPSSSSSQPVRAKRRHNMDAVAAWATWRLPAVSAASVEASAPAAASLPPPVAAPASAPESWPARLNAPAVLRLAYQPLSSQCDEASSGSQLMPDDDILERDGEEALSRVLSTLLSHGDPLFHAVGLFGMEMTEMLVIHALSTPDPRVTALAVLACTRQASRMTVFGPNREVLLFTPSACSEPMARRWVQLSPDNGNAWVAWASTLLELDQVEEAGLALERAVQAEQWEGYRGLLSAVVVQVMPQGLSWWQRYYITTSTDEIFLGLRLTGFVLRTYCNYNFRAAIALPEPTRAPVCQRLAARMMEQENNEYLAVMGLRFGRGLSLRSKQIAGLEQVWQDAMEERWGSHRNYSEDDWRSCREAARDIRRDMRAHLEGGMVQVRRDAERYRRRMAARPPQPEPEMAQEMETADASESEDAGSESQDEE